MIPSDHFVRMYNELFKMLEERGHSHLQEYWRNVSESQDMLIGPYIQKDGLKGMYDYWEKIRIEENCDAGLSLTDDYFEFVMNKCPSLSKAIDNDAGVCDLYCDHCAGWVEPIMEKYGFHYVCDMISRSEPKCMFRVYRDTAKADEFRKKIKLPLEPYGDR